MVIRGKVFAANFDLVIIVLSDLDLVMDHRRSSATSTRHPTTPPPALDRMKNCIKKMLENLDFAGQSIEVKINIFRRGTTKTHLANF